MLGHVGRHVHDQFQLLLGCLFRDQRGGGVQQAFHLERPGVDLQHASLDLAEVEHVVDDAQQVLARLLDLLHIVPLLRVHGCVQRQVAHADDGVHRRADLVAHVGQEVALVLVGGFCSSARLLGFLEHAGVLDGDHHLLREGLELKVHLRRKGAGPQPHQRDHANTPTLPHQRRRQRGEVVSDALGRALDARRRGRVVQGIG